MKTYVLTVSKTFPKTHKRAGESTEFVYNISRLFLLDNTKIHTIRANYPLWARRAKEINAGRAILSIRYWSGKPYNSKQIEICRLEKIEVQQLFFEYGQLTDPFVRWQDSKNGNTTHISIYELAKNDGLTLDDFKDWFKKYDLSKPMAIIHFTTFRY